MDLNNIQRVYFIGIGGIGMSAIARFFNEKGVHVSGYDRTETPLTRQLAEEGMQIHYSDDVNLLDKDAQLVVYTPAIPGTHGELIWYRKNEYEVVKRSDVLQEITKELFAITVGGTHGKTTISTLTAHILRHSGYGCNAFLGGISANYDRNFWSSDKQVAVIEADEYDRSFLKLHPDIAVLTAMDADHLDIYGTEADMQDAFVQYTANIKPNGTLIAKLGLSRAGELKGDNKRWYHLKDSKANIYATNIRTVDGGYLFDVVEQDWHIHDVKLPIGGTHNIENAVAAITVAHLLGIDAAKIKAAIADFKGIKRRFEYLVKNDYQVYIDDYAHHPEELRALISSARGLFPDKRCTVIFQPHLYTRTRDLAAGFAESLSLADEVLLLPIYPARELPIEGVRSEILAEKITVPVQVIQKEDVLAWVKSNSAPLLITAGAGDIDQFRDPIKEILNGEKVNE
ncbi:UDP-N-acetylmuramate--L-alanine ligase [Chitinophaga sancti]|uniref:UDP-N-acetylmuramate--L-alanine ligase n=1 Tax=Chitinophaga sancti TaxID=1004 RepID=A0A1K1PF93_9BACT|nr:UDP-N-acetylmuramate--L-alanine ligase [Chitinophaga sancti]WQD65761.1 UDP-N-acetylmuramate--L-alanine ligase [Chitinophaga sancti]WQG88617.1 UDP-N-acetylmuramate--L-alanine ligase [Chitinophaga sancti]SFW45350.1 UDP-N-acetylmuramate--L-alanine ligase [Chitinophaga sancti]